MPFDPADIKTVYEFLMAIRRELEVRNDYMDDPVGAINKTNIDDEEIIPGEEKTAMQALKDGDQSAINAYLVHEGRSVGAVVKEIQRYIHY